MDWYYDDKNPILWREGKMYVFDKDNTLSANPNYSFICTDLIKVSDENSGTAYM
jgi:hypothetical protein